MMSKSQKTDAIPKRLGAQHDGVGNGACKPLLLLW